jgi:hypothetical protein
MFELDVGFVETTFSQDITVTPGPDPYLTPSMTSDETARSLHAFLLCP